MNKANKIQPKRKGTFTIKKADMTFDEEKIDKNIED